MMYIESLVTKISENILFNGFIFTYITTDNLAQQMYYYAN